MYTSIYHSFSVEPTKDERLRSEYRIITRPEASYYRFDYTGIKYGEYATLNLVNDLSIFKNKTIEICIILDIEKQYYRHIDYNKLISG